MLLLPPWPGAGPGVDDRGSHCFCAWGAAEAGRAGAGAPAVEAVDAVRLCLLPPNADENEVEMELENEENVENGGREDDVPALEGGLLTSAGAGSTDMGRSGAAQRRREGALTAADI